MKAIVVEIYKDYCMVITRNGQFLKERISAGSFEIGDEITIEQTALEKSAGPASMFRIITRTAIGFAALAIVVVGAYFGVQYMRTDTRATEIAMAMQDQSQEIKSAAAEDSVEPDEPSGAEEGVIAPEEEPGAVEKSLEEKEVSFKSMEELFSGTFSLEKIDTEFLIENDTMYISYSINEMHDTDQEIPEEEKLRELTLKFKNIKENSFLDGNADIILLYRDMSISDVEKILFENLNYDQQNTRKISFSEETNFKLIVFGLFR